MLDAFNGLIGNRCGSMNSCPLLRSRSRLLEPSRLRLLLRFGPGLAGLPLQLRLLWGEPACRPLRFLSDPLPGLCSLSLLLGDPLGLMPLRLLPLRLLLSEPFSLLLLGLLPLGLLLALLLQLLLTKLLLLGDGLRDLPLGAALSLLLGLLLRRRELGLTRAR